MAGRLVEKTEEQVQEEIEKAEDEVMMEELRKIGDTCVEMLKTEADCPSKHPELGKKVPILDMCVWVEEVELPAAPGLEGQEAVIHSKCGEGGPCLPIGGLGLEAEGNVEGGGVEAGPAPACRLVTQVYYTFFRKPMAPSRFLMASSAHPWQQKRTTLTQEVIGRLMRTKKELNCKHKQEILTEFMQLMKNSGYCSKFRREVLQAGLTGYNKILTADKDGTKPLFRSREWRRSARGLEAQKKRKRKKGWMGGEFKSVIFVPPTPGGELKKRLQAREEELRPGGREEWKIRIVETAGKSVERSLVNNDPCDGNKCDDEKCLVNKSETNKINCRRNNVTYEVRCKICLGAGWSKKYTCYLGETGQNLHTRMKNHLSKYYSKQQHIRDSSAFYKHLTNKHEDLIGSKFEDVFEIRTVKAYNKVFTRVVEEGTLIEKHEGELLNSKSEWHQPRIIRTVVFQGGAEIARGAQEVDDRRAGGYQGAGGRDEGGGGGGGVEGGAVEGGARAEDTPLNNISSRTRSRRNCK